MSRDEITDADRIVAALDRLADIEEAFAAKILEHHAFAEARMKRLDEYEARAEARAIAAEARHVEAHKAEMERVERARQRESSWAAVSASMAGIAGELKALASDAPPPVEGKAAS